ncbi:MAG TPA: hypothetical protein VF017_19230 [Thermoanaerobaculia bacterium]|nr:hypothetical protein [Thermoanaerobaculia bacterium]
MSSDRGLAQLAQLVIALVALAATVAGVWIGYQQLTESRRAPVDRAIGPATPPGPQAPPDRPPAHGEPPPYRSPLIDPTPADQPVHTRFSLHDGQSARAAEGKVSVRAFTTQIGASKEWEVRMLVAGEVLKCAVTSAPLDCGTLEASGTSYRLSVEGISPEGGSLEVMVDEIR